MEENPNGLINGSNIIKNLLRNYHREKNFHKLSIYEKIHKYFSQIELDRLKFTNDDKDSYGDMVIKGLSFKPKKVNMDFIEKRREEIALFHFDDEKQKKYIRHNISYTTKNVLGNNNESSPNINFPTISSVNKSINAQNERCKSVKGNNLMKIMYKDKDRFSEYNYINNKVNQITRCKKSGSVVKMAKLPLLHNNINVIYKNVKQFLETNKLEVQNYKNKRFHQIKKENFLKRYDSTAEITNRLNFLNNSLKSMSYNLEKDMDMNDESKPQFELRFKALIDKFKI